MNKLRKTIIKIVALAIFSDFNLNTCLYADFLDESTTAIEERIAPIGNVYIASPPTTEALKTAIPTLKKDSHLGRLLFNSKCILCHGSGIAGAPRLGNKTDWAPRAKKELTVLLKHVENGYHAMPPKGACLECSTADLEAAIKYMLAQTPS